jgi:hypothetical protein
LKDENIARADKRHRCGLTQPTDDFSNPESGIAYRLSRNSGSETAEQERDEKPPAQSQLPPVVFVEHFEFAPVSLWHDLPHSDGSIKRIQPVSFSLTHFIPQRAEFVDPLPSP